MPGCPDPEMLQSFLEGRLEPTGVHALREHAVECATCLRLLALVEVAERSSSSEVQAPASSAAAIVAGSGTTLDWHPPEHIDEYRVLRPLGHGAMGQVHIAHDTSLDRAVAIKFIAPGKPDRAAQDRFLVEARAIARLSHKNVVSVYRVGAIDGHPYLVSELIRGQSLDQLPLPLPWEQVLQIGLGLARGLGAAHQRGVLHRDLKPANAILTDDGEVKLLDFGLAKLLDFEVAQPLDARATPAPGETSAAGASAPPEDLMALALGAMGPGPAEGAAEASPMLTKTGSVIGTPHYMAPEIWHGTAATAAADVYSIGALLYELCTGHPPHEGDSLRALYRRVQAGAPPPLVETVPGFDPRLGAIVDRCLLRDPAQRFPSGQELALALDVLSQRLLQSAALPAPPPRRLARLTTYAAAALSASLLAGVVVLQRRGPSRNADAVTPAAAAPAPAPAAPAAATVRRSVAILGFQDQADRPELAWFSAGLSEMIGPELAAGEKLQVIPADSVARMRAELKLPILETYPPDMLARIQANLGADLVLSGAYQAPRGQGAGRLRIIARLLDSRTGAALASVWETGTEAELCDIAARFGGGLRRQLGISELSPAAANGLAAAHPVNVEAARHYALGRERLRLFDAEGARGHLTSAALADPGYPFTHLALAEALAAAGRDDEARKEARKAFDLAGKLSQEDRLLIEASFRSINREWDKAADVYRSIATIFPDNLEYGLSLVETLSRSGRPAAEAKPTVERLRRLPAPTQDDPRIDLAESYVAQSSLDFPRMQMLLSRAASKAEARGARLLLAMLRNREAYPAMVLGDYQTAVTRAEEARRIFAEVGNRWMVAEASENLAQALRFQGHLSAALAMNDEAQQLWREMGRKVDLWLGLGRAGDILTRQGKLEAAREKLEESLRLARDASDKNRSVPGALLRLGWISLLQGDLAEARSRLDQAASLYGDDQALPSLALWHQGELLLAQGDLPEARKKHERSLAMREQGGLKGYAGESRVALAVVSLEEDRPEEAESLARKALPQFQAARQLDHEAWAHAVLARSLHAQGKLPEARQASARATARTEKSEQPILRMFAQRIAARIHAASGERADIAEAHRSLDRTLGEATKAGLVGEQLETRLVLGELELGAGQETAARARLTKLRWEAESKGFGLIARRAGEFLGVTTVDIDGLR